jgi:flagellar hook-basal body complex protein FliE
MPTVPPVGVNDLSTQGSEWSVGSVGDVGTIQDGSQATQGAGGFGGMLSNSIQSLQGLQDQAATASDALATGQASDPSSVVMAVERARLGMQLASQIRNKAVEAYTDIFHTQV